MVHSGVHDFATREVRRRFGIAQVNLISALTLHELSLRSILAMAYDQASLASARLFSMKSGCDSDIEASFMSLTLHGLWLNEMVEKFSLNIDNPIYILR